MHVHPSDRSRVCSSAGVGRTAAARPRSPPRCIRARAATIRAVLTTDEPVARHSSFAAAFFSFLLPGLGQMYCRRFLRGCSGWSRGLSRSLSWPASRSRWACATSGRASRHRGCGTSSWASASTCCGGCSSVLDAFWVARAPTRRDRWTRLRTCRVRRRPARDPRWCCSSAMRGRDGRSTGLRRPAMHRPQIECEDELAEDPGIEDPDDPGIVEPGESTEPLPSLPPTGATPRRTPTPRPSPASPRPSPRDQRTPTQHPAGGHQRQPSRTRSSW